MTDITAKVKVTDNISLGQDDYAYHRILFDADYEDGRNAAWAVATPAINIGMNVKPSIARQFELGKRVTLTFHVEGEPEDVELPEEPLVMTPEPPVGTTMGVPHEPRPEMKAPPWSPDKVKEFNEEAPYPPTHPKGQHGLEALDNRNGNWD